MSCFVWVAVAPGTMTRGYLPGAPVARNLLDFPAMQGRKVTVLLRAMLVALAVTAVASAPAASALDAPASAAAKKKKKKKKCPEVEASAKKKKKKKRCPSAPPFAEIRITPEIFNFGVVTPPNSPQTVLTVRNNGTAASGNVATKLDDRSTFMGNPAPSPPLAITANSCSGPIPPGGSCEITVKFTPFLPDVKGAAILSVGANPGGSQTAGVFGTS